MSDLYELTLLYFFEKVIARVCNVTGTLILSVKLHVAALRMDTKTIESRTRSQCVNALLLGQDEKPSPRAVRVFKFVTVEGV